MSQQSDTLSIRPAKMNMVYISRAGHSLTRAVCLGIFSSYIGSVIAQDTSDRNFEFYASVRTHLDIARVDEAKVGEECDYVGARDAYSRVGVRGDFDFSNINVLGTLELGINTADFDLGDPSFFDDQNFRVASIKLGGDFGTLVAGKDWLPYYNVIAAPVDFFSSVYAGFTTYAFFRENQITYSSQIKSLGYSVAAIQRTNGGPRGWQATARYPLSSWTFAAGGEYIEGSPSDTFGLSAIWQRDKFYAAFKFEHNTDQGQIYNGFGQYQWGRTHLKLGLGLGDQFGGINWHIGADYQLLSNLKLFAEIYTEELNYAILVEGADSSNEFLGAGGFGARQNGRAFALGARWDFKY